VNLGDHPDIYTATEEISYFNDPRRFRRGRASSWYRSQFGGWDGEPVVGEATPGYMFLRHDPKAVARRIDRTLPDVRLVALLRNPIDRANSALLHHVKRGRLPAKTRLVKIAKKSRDPKIKRLGLIDGGLYAASLRPFVKRFGSRLLVLLHDDVRADPDLVYWRVLLHVGAEPSFRPAALREVVFSNRRPSDSAGGLSQADRVQMWRYFADDVRRLQRMIGRDLSSWNPEHTPQPPVQPVDVSGQTTS
jgi:hypothetical protein